MSAFIAACALPHVKLFAILAATTGARMGAIVTLTWDRVDLEKARVDPLPRPGNLSGPRRAERRRRSMRSPARPSLDARTRRDDALRYRMGGTARRVRKERLRRPPESAQECLGLRRMSFDILPRPSWRRAASRWLRSRRCSVTATAAQLSGPTLDWLPDFLRRAARNARILMVGAVGIEPTTPSMSPRCSTAELSALSVQSNRNPFRNPLPYQRTPLSCQGSALPLS